MDWFRFYSEALDDPKVQRLPAALFKHWVNLLCLANKGTPRGALPDLAGIAFRLRVREPEAEQIVAKLLAENLLERTTNGQLFPHNWDGRQQKSDDINARVAKHRAAKSGTKQAQSAPHPEGYVTLQETLHTPECNDPDTDTEEDQNRVEIPPTPQTNTPPPPVAANAAGGMRPAPKTDQAGGYRGIFDLVAQHRGVDKLTWNFGREAKALNALLAAEPRAAPADLVAYLDYLTNVWPYVNEPTRQPKFSDQAAADHWAAWWQQGRPTEPQEVQRVQSNTATRSQERASDLRRVGTWLNGSPTPDRRLDRQEPHSMQSRSAYGGRVVIDGARVG